MQNETCLLVSAHSEHCTASHAGEEGGLIQGVYFCGLISVNFVWASSGFGGLGVACWPLVPKFAGSNPAEAVGFLRGEKNPQQKVKPSVPCRRFAACKRSLNVAWKSTFRQNYRTTFSPTVPTSAAGISHAVADVEAPGGEKWERLKSGGKQWQNYP